MNEEPAPVQALEGIQLTVGFFARGAISPVVLWDELTAALSPGRVEDTLGSLSASQQAILRGVYSRWPRALRSEGRDDAVRRAIERWCQTRPEPAGQPDNKAEPAFDFPRWTTPGPRPAGPLPQPATEPAPLDELGALRACYREYGYVRRPCALYALRADDREWEVRFVMRFKYELTKTQQVLLGAGFTPGEPSRKYGYHVLSVPGRTAVERLLALVARRG
jgi:hypothetical protein